MDASSAFMPLVLSVWAALRIYAPSGETGPDMWKATHCHCIKAALCSFLMSHLKKHSTCCLMLVFISWWFPTSHPELHILNDWCEQHYNAMNLTCLIAIECV